MNDTSDTIRERPVAPVPQMEDVPEEEWGYWTAQAFAGCGVVLALMLAMFLPLMLAAVMDDTLGKLIGFVVAGSLAVLSIAIISRLTYRDRARRRAELLERIGDSGEEREKVKEEIGVAG